MSWYRFKPYVSVAKRKQNAEKQAKKLKKKGEECYPVIIEGRTIASTFWGRAWCDHLESYSDYANRLPRGRTYVRNGSVIDLKVGQGEIAALVSGSSIYKVKISIAQVATSKWNNIVKKCAGKIDSLIELLQGKFSTGVMQMMTNPEGGLFPHPNEIKLSCSCPDWADMCKHVAAVLYGVGARLDNRPEELFMLRQVDHAELIAKAGTASLTQSSMDQSDKMLAGSDLSSLFSIDMGDSSQKDPAPSNKSKQLKKKTPAKKRIKSIKKTTKRQVKPAIPKKKIKKKSSIPKKRVKKKSSITKKRVKEKSSVVIKKDKKSVKKVKKTNMRKAKKIQKT